MVPLQGGDPSDLADDVIQALKHVAQQLEAFERLGQLTLAAEKRGIAEEPCEGNLEELREGNVEEPREDSTVVGGCGLYSRLMDSVPEVCDPALAFSRRRTVGSLEVCCGTGRFAAVLGGGRLIVWICIWFS